MDFLDIYCLVFTVLFGLVFGSFLNCMAMRIVRHEDFVKGRSHCMSCGHTLGGVDLIPVAGYILSGGKCRYCKEHISIRYPISELLFALLLAGVYLHSGLGLVTVRDMIFTACLFSLALVDIESYTIPDGILLAGLLDWIVFSFLVYGDIKTAAIHLAGGAGAFLVMLGISLIMDRVLGKESMGGGDIKLFGVIGLFTGPLGAYFLVIISCVIGLVVAGLYSASGRMKEGGAFPFGPSIAIAGYIMLIFGERITYWYMGLF